ncbi:MAG: GntR family transcriptional regulator [Chloroflexi bacterium]|nr:GntR family transcriptional regulator [Chloroflexota bacterium]
MLQRVKSSNLRDQVVQQIRTAIIEGRIKPNDHIVEKDLTDQLGVSRTPVREALILLEREGLVCSIPNRGSFVRSFSERAVEQIFSMRVTLENFAAELVVDTLTTTDFAVLEHLIFSQSDAIERDDFNRVRSIDMAFHQYFIEKTDHALLHRTWSELVAQIAALLFLRADAFPDYDEFRAIHDHQAILHAYHARDLNAIRANNVRINKRVADECRQSVGDLHRD